MTKTKEKLTDQQVLELCKKEGCNFVKTTNEKLICAKGRTNLDKLLTKGCDSALIPNPSINVKTYMEGTMVISEDRSRVDFRNAPMNSHDISDINLRPIEGY